MKVVKEETQRGFMQIEELVYESNKRCRTQEALIKFLREFHFQFTSVEVLPYLTLLDPTTPPVDIKTEHTDYQVMVRIPLRGNTPEDDRYDTRVLFLIKIMGPKVNEVQVYKFGKFAQTLYLPWPYSMRIDHEAVKPKVKFPDAMSIDMRKEWRYIDAKIKSGKTLKEEQVQFHRRWADQVVYKA